MISLCFFIFVLSNSATCEIWNNKLTKVFTYGSPGNPMEIVFVNINGSFINIYIFGPGNNNNNEDKTTGNPATATENPATATENPATATETPDTTTQRTDITTQEPGGKENSTETPRVVYDSCEDAVREGRKTDVYRIKIPNSLIEPFDVVCMLDTFDRGGWTVIQRRIDGKVDFYRNWSNYESGFGDLHADYFLGLKIIHELTRRKKYRLNIRLVDWSNRIRIARYKTFSIDNAINKYKIRLGPFDAEAEDLDAGDGMEHRNFQKFSTYDNDNDDFPYGNCAKDRQTGWWIRECQQSDLNGPYFTDTINRGIQWDTWHGLNNSYKYVHMVMKPTFRDKNK